MKNITWFFSLSLLLIAGTAAADRSYRYYPQPATQAYVYAKVVKVEPIYTISSPPPVSEGIWLAGSCEGEACYTSGDTRASAEPVEYRVTYNFRGREFQTRLDREPGQWIRITYSPARYWRM